MLLVQELVQASTLRLEISCTAHAAWKPHGDPSQAQALVMKHFRHWETGTAVFLGTLGTKAPSLWEPGGALSETWFYVLRVSLRALEPSGNTGRVSPGSTGHPEPRLHLP